MQAQLQVQAMKSPVLRAPTQVLPVRQLQPVTPSAQSQSPAVLAPQDRLAASAPKGAIPALAPLFQTSEPALPPIEVVQRDNYTYSRNAFGVQITHVKMDAGNYYYLLSDQGLCVMLRQNDGKRDTFNLTDMNFNIPSPSKFPNVFFHVNGDGPSQISFTPEHHVRIDLPNGDYALFDRENGQVLREGPFQIAFFPDEAGQNFDVKYTGNDSTVKRLKSKGDNVQW
jgi:hypothetical protein